MQLKYKQVKSVAPCVFLLLYFFQKLKAEFSGNGGTGLYEPELIKGGGESEQHSMKITLLYIFTTRFGIEMASKNGLIMYNPTSKIIKSTTTNVHGLTIKQLSVRRGKTKKQL